MIITRKHISHHGKYAFFAYDYNNWKTYHCSLIYSEE